MDDDNGGWTVFQRRQPSCNPSNFFSKGWANYVKGFGDPNNEFWLGLEALHHLTWDEKESLEMKITFTDFDGNKTVVLVKNFKVGNATKLYAVDFSSLTRDGKTVSDAYFTKKKTKFSTIDRDNDLT